MKKRILYIISAFVLLCFPAITFAQIDLGTASSFALFTSIGAFDNIGASNITGDIGTNAGSLTGFPPGIHTGQVHVADSVSLLTVNDVQFAYDTLTAISCDSALGSTLGNNQILLPNVYCISTASTLNGDLTLDAQGDANAVFIFKIDGLFDASSLSNVILINSASRNKVYWQVNGAFSLGTDAVFNGTVVANGAISLYANSTLNGRGLSRAGAIYIDQATATEPSVMPPLPIELLHFKGVKEQFHNQLSWSSASELNNDYYVLYRTSDGNNFTEITRMKGAGTSSSTNYYTFSDYNFENKINYYRLKQMDYDGQSKSFDLISIDNFKTSNKNMLKIINLSGQEVNPDYNGIRVIIYEDGTFEKKYSK